LDKIVQCLYTRCSTDYDDANNVKWHGGGDGAAAMALRATVEELSRTYDAGSSVTNLEDYDTYAVRELLLHHLKTLREEGRRELEKRGARYVFVPMISSEEHYETLAGVAGLCYEKCSDRPVNANNNEFVREQRLKAVGKAIARDPVRAALLYRTARLVRLLAKLRGPSEYKEFAECLVDAPASSAARFSNTGRNSANKQTLDAAVVQIVCENLEKMFG
jgi:hypothetical protein